MSSRLLKIFLFCLLAAIPAGYNACKGTSGADLRTELTTIGGNGTVSGNPFETNGWIYSYYPQRRHVGCLKGVWGFLELDPLTNIHPMFGLTFTSPRVVEFNPDGLTDLGDLGLPDGKFAIIQLLFGAGCDSPLIPSDKSLVINNKRGSISVDDSFGFNFIGRFEKPSPVEKDVYFNFQSFINVFEGAQEESDLLTTIGQTSGGFGPQTSIEIAGYDSGDTNIFGCLSAIYFHDGDGEVATYFVPKLIHFSSDGVDLGKFSLPASVRIVRLHFGGQCPNELGPYTGLRVVNSNGSFFDYPSADLNSHGYFDGINDVSKRMVIDHKTVLDIARTGTDWTQLVYYPGTFSPGQ